jgi:hypothetical protein
VADAISAAGLGAADATFVAGFSAAGAGNAALVGARGGATGDGAWSKVGVGASGLTTAGAT